MALFRRFVLDRKIDESGVSGIGKGVAEGVQFSDGKCVISWCTSPNSKAIYDSIEILVTLHGHGGATSIRWVD